MTDNVHFTEHCNPTLKAQAEKLLPALNAVLYGWVVVDAQVRIVGANDDYLAFIGKDFNAIANRPMREINAGSHLPTVVSSGEPEFLYLLTYDGKKHCIASGIPLHDEEAKVVLGAIGIVVFKSTDIARLQPFLTAVGDLRRREHDQWRALHTFHDIIGTSQALRKAKDLAKQVANKDCPVLLQGETGTGKELFAQAIHNASYRKDAPFVPINVAGISRDRLEEELYGVAAFAGASHVAREGRMKLADGGTLFLDDVSELPLPTQAFLLRVLEEKMVTRVGLIRRFSVDVRVISASCRDLEALVQDGRFLEALYFRLQGVTITLPPLRQLTRDMPDLCAHMLRDITDRWGEGRRIIGDGLIDELNRRQWNGNVRELRHVLERVCIHHNQTTLTAKDLEKERLLPPPEPDDPPVRALIVVRREAERKEIFRALRECDGRLTDAARLLCVGRRTLYNRMRALNIPQE